MALELLYSDTFEEFKSESNIILWGNEKKWIFKEQFECKKVKTSEFKSYSNCFVCYGNKQIELELSLTESEINEIAENLKIKNDGNKI